MDCKRRRVVCETHNAVIADVDVDVVRCRRDDKGRRNQCEYDQRCLRHEVRYP